MTPSLSRSWQGWSPQAAAPTQRHSWAGRAPLHLGEHQRKASASAPAPAAAQASQQHPRGSNKSSSSASASSGDDRASSKVSGAPWSLTFDIRERETEWTEENKARLVAIVASQQLGIPMSDMEQRLDALMLLLPDLAGKVPQLPPALLVGLTRDLAGITSSRLLALRELLPDANVSWLVSQRPQLLLQEPAEVAEAVARLKQLMKLQHVDKLVEAMPLFLVTECVEEVLAELARLMPGAGEPAALLAADPDLLLRLQRGQRYLGLHPDSDPGEQISWQPPNKGARSGGGT